MSDNIKVAVRMRGLIPREIQSKATTHWIANDNTSICQTNSGSSPFVFDRVFNSSETNNVIYEEFCAPIVKSVINGFNGTIFAYGQTSSGKTFTIMGDDGINMGIAQHTVSDLFDLIQNLPDREFLLRVSYMEIYNEMVVDLLSNSGENLKLQEDQYGNIKVVKLTETIVQEPTQVLDLMRKGQRHRKTGDTFMNNKSSRSHSIFRMIVESGIRGKENAAVNVSIFNLVDLAGSEKASLNTPKGTRFKEGVNINKSLFMLSQVISQLSAEKEYQFINYRDSKLTRILQNSLGGNALTAIICTVTPASLDETLSTLKFALRAKKIKNKPKINEVETEQALLKKYANKIKKLCEELEATKEEKDQEKKKRRDMQQQIENLKKKFVTYVVPEKSRAARRETWGGCIDVARLKMFPPSKDLLLPHEMNMKEDIDKLSMPFPQDRGFRKERLRSKESLPALEEESDINTDLLDESCDVVSFRNRKSTLSSKCSLGWTYECFKTDAEVQTDVMSSENLELHSELSQRISNLENELSELKEFTRLEKQICKDVHAERISESFAVRKSILPADELRCIENINKSFEDLNEEHAEVIKNLSNINTKFTRNEFNLEHEMFFDHLTEIINKLNKLLNTQVELCDISNPSFKIIFQLFHLIFKSQHTLYTTTTKNFSGEIDRMFDFLQKILMAINSEKCSNESYTDLISKFVDVTDNVFKEIEAHKNGSDKNDDSVFLTFPKEAGLGIPDLITNSYSESVYIPHNLNIQKIFDTKDSQTSFYDNEAKESQTSFYDNEAKESQTSFWENNNEAKESQTSFWENNNEAKESQTSFYGNNNEVKESQTSFQENDNEVKESQTSFNENISSSEIICQCAEKINFLELKIQNYLKEISNLSNSCELKEKQIALTKEKVSIKDQIISSLKNELALKNKEIVNNTEFSIDKKYPDLKHAASQTYYLNSKFYSPTKDEMNYDVIYEQSTPKNCMAEISDIMEQSANNILTSDVKGINFIIDKTQEQCDSICDMNIILKELLSLKDNAQKIIKDNMQLAYIQDIFEKESETRDKCPLEQVKKEIEILRDIIHRIEFYLKDRSEASDYLNNVLAKQKEETFSLQRRCSATEIYLKEKETHLEFLSEALSSLRKSTEERLSVHIPITYSEFTDCETDTPIMCDINYLEKTISNLENLVRDKDFALTSMKELKEKK